MDVYETHPGFTITCEACGSTDVAVTCSLGFSSLSGSWGSVDLECQKCDKITSIVEA